MLVLRAVSTHNFWRWTTDRGISRIYPRRGNMRLVLDMKLYPHQASPRRCRRRKHRADRDPEPQRAYERFHALYAHQSDFQILSHSQAPWSSATTCRCSVRSTLFSALRLSASVPSALTPAAAASKSGLIRVISLSIHVHARLFSERALSPGHEIVPSPGIASSLPQAKTQSRQRPRASEGV